MYKLLFLTDTKCNFQTSFNADDCMDVNKFLPIIVLALYSSSSKKRHWRIAKDKRNRI